MPIQALNRWLAAQAALWSTLLALAALAIAAERFEGWMLWPTAALWLLSHASLWVILRSGRTIADRVTLLRFFGLLVAAGWIATRREIDWPVWALLVGVVLLDLLDGWCARRFGGSEQGAVLDMETDQMTTLGLALLAAGLKGAGIWTLLLPGLKYVFVLWSLGAGLPAHDPKPRAGDNRRGRRICAAVLALLLASLCPAVSPALARVATILAVLALSYSFSSDAAFLWKRRRSVLRGG